MQSRADLRFDSDLGVYGLPGTVAPWRTRFDLGDRAFCDLEADGRYRIRIVTEPGLTDALLVVGEHGATAVGHRLEQIGEAGSTTLWEGLFDLQPGSRFSFAFRTPQGRPLYLVPAGVAVAVERLDRWEVPDLDPLTIPLWAQGNLIYQIFPDRFADGDPSNNPADTDPWGSEPTPFGFQGGDLQGITEHLDYLVSLGVGVIYLNPVAVSPSNHRYDTMDHNQVEPSLGGNEALSRLVAEAHERGIRVMTDLSINHVHPTFGPFQDVMEQGPQSPYADWFAIHSYPPRLLVDSDRLEPENEKWLGIWQEELSLGVEEVSRPGPPIRPTYDAWFGVPSMPRVDLSHPPARRYMLDVLTGWVDRFDIDAWRMDVARYVDPDVWPEARRELTSVKPDFFLLAEIMGDASHWLQGDGFHAAMNYSFRAAILDFLAYDTIDASGFTEAYLRLLGQYAWPVTLACHNLIGSHDTPRFLTEANGEEWRLELALVMQMTLPGSPGIYYGDEVGLEGGEDPECRRAFPWDADPLDHPLARAVAALSEVRRSHPALVTGEWRAGIAEGGLLTYRRTLGDDEIWVAVNRDDRSRRVEHGASLIWGEGSVAHGQVEVAARSAAIYSG